MKTGKQTGWRNKKWMKEKKKQERWGAKGKGAGGNCKNGGKSRRETQPASFVFLISFFSSRRNKSNS